MARRIFISYQHEDQMKAKGFHLLRWNKNVDLEFVGRHLLDPVHSNNEQYIGRKIIEQLTGSSVTVVLIGQKTCNSEWVRWEIEQSLKKDKPNGILGIRLDDNSPLPPDSPVGEILRETGAEIIDWDPRTFDDAIERAFAACRRAVAIRNAGSMSTSCVR